MSQQHGPRAVWQRGAGSPAASAWSGWARWVPASSRSSPATASTWSRVEIDDDGAGARARATSRRPPTGRSPAASSPRTSGTRSRPDHASRRRWTTWPTSTSSSRPCPSTSTSSSEIFARAGPDLQPDAILATNTSSLSVTEISVATRRPDQVIGMHFFNPAPVQKLVEVVRTVVTDARGASTTSKALAARLGKVDGRRRRPGRLHRQRAAVRLPQPRRRRCSSRATPPARTSTPRCSSAAGCRWARSR